jgi:hypothetical protein
MSEGVIKLTVNRDLHPWCAAFMDLEESITDVRNMIELAALAQTQSKDRELAVFALPSDWQGRLSISTGRCTQS